MKNLFTSSYLEQKPIDQLDKKHLKNQKPQIPIGSNLKCMKNEIKLTRKG